MDKSVQDIQETLRSWGEEVSAEAIAEYQKLIETTRSFFPGVKNFALTVQLIRAWEANPNRKILTVSHKICHIEGGPCVTSFGVLSRDWPGLSNACLGVFHDRGWNIHFIEGYALIHRGVSLAIILIGVRTETEEETQRLMEEIADIEFWLRQAASLDEGKQTLLFDEMRKIQLFGRVIQEIQRIYLEPDIQNIIGLDGEAVKFFAARSRDYLENRQVEDLARQIVSNYTLIKKAKETGGSIQIEISNFETKKDGLLSGVTICGSAGLLNLEECLGAIESVVPSFILKHNREFTTPEGISLFRIELVDGRGRALSKTGQTRLKKALRSLILEKRRGRTEWIEAVGGFEQYLRAIIPLLVREAESSDTPQVYLSVAQQTEAAIEFKIICVFPDTVRFSVADLIRAIDSFPGLHIQNFRPPKPYGKIQVFIFDTKAQIKKIGDLSEIYAVLHERIRSVIGEFRDFDQGMRTMDVIRMKAVAEQLPGIDRTLFRELYYSIEDFLRVGAPVYEIVGHIRLGWEMIQRLSAPGVQIQLKTVGYHSPAGKFLPHCTLLGIAYPTGRLSLSDILARLAPYEVTLSRLQRGGKDILICRLTDQDKALTDAQTEDLLKALEPLKSAVS